MVKGKGFFYSCVELVCESKWGQVYMLLFEPATCKRAVVNGSPIDFMAMTTFPFVPRYEPYTLELPG